MRIFETSPLSDFVPVRGEGCWLWDERGTRYLDLLSGTWCNVLGQGNPRFVSAVKRQVEKLVHTGTGVVPREISDAAGRLGEILPKHLEAVTFLNTGSEAVEFALKAARIATGRTEVVGFREGYYGATSNALALSEVGRGAAYLPGASEVPPIPSPNCHSCPIRESFPACKLACLREWQATAERHRENVAAIIFEPVQGRGIVVPPEGYLSALQKIAREWSCKLIAEEVTTGIGRTGRWFGFQKEDLSPDILVLGKALGNGLPVAAVVTTSEVERAFAGKAIHAQSHQNDPFSGAVASAVIDTIREEGLLERVTATGELLLRELKRMKKTHSGVSDARGLGLMAALELGSIRADEKGREVQRRLREDGILLGYSQPVASFRFFPPYVISEPQLDAALERLDSVLRTTE